jgi:hypothetical protein
MSLKAWHRADRGWVARLVAEVAVAAPALVLATGCGPDEVGSVKPPPSVAPGQAKKPGPTTKGRPPAQGWLKPRPHRTP